MKFFLLTKNVYYDRITNRYTVNIKDGRHSGIGGQMAEKATNMTGTPFPDKETELTISDMTDEQLVSRITQTGGEKYATVLIKRYIPVISAKSAKMSLRCPSADKDDLFSEGLLGLLKAIRLYNSEKGASFVTFANLCTDSAMKTCISKAIKDNPLSNCEDFDFDLIKDDSLSPEDTVIDKVQDSQLMNRLSDVLSKKEMKVLEMYPCPLLLRADSKRAFNERKICRQCTSACKIEDKKINGEIRLTKSFSYYYTLKA